MTKYKLVIFDWDGTLMDSVSRIVSSVQDAAIALNVKPPSDDESKSIIGLSLRKAVNQLFPDVSDELQIELEKQYSYQYIEVNNTPAPLFDYVIELISLLKENNVFVAVATGKTRVGLERVLKATQTEHLFDTTRTACDARSKPDPEMITSLLTELNIKPCDAVMIGDTSFDMEMAQNANIDRIGVSFGAHTVDVIKKYQPKAIVNSFVELEKLLIKIT